MTTKTILMRQGREDRLLPAPERRVLIWACGTRVYSPGQLYDKELLRKVKGTRI